MIGDRLGFGYRILAAALLMLAAAPVLAEIRNTPVTRPVEETRILSYEYGQARGAIFAGPNPAACPWWISGSEESGDPGIRIEISCALKPTPSVLVFRAFGSTRLNNSWSVRDVFAVTRDETAFVGTARPTLSFVERPVLGMRDPRTVIRVTVPPFSATGVDIRIKVGRIRPPAATPLSPAEPLFMCDIAGPGLAGPSPASFRCSSDSQCRAGYTCGHPICGNVCVGPRTGP